MDEYQRRGRILVAIAREAIQAGEPPRAILREWGEAWLRETAASFVTLREAGDLRGCIGTVDAHRALGDDVTHNAHAAAYRDSRFPPLTIEVRDRIEIEVSVLSPRVPIAADTESAAARALRPGVDGVVLEYESFRATFLPQVWESLPDPVDFLAELRRKARLPARFWHPQLKVSRYTVEKYR
ncbi:MAG TPA: AmmeMemoRadiSam system protein A [Usitatibacter sp.]|nr:AmmeMemoRadiSam system protein A [Usitatibacter sp.]